jgi:hypothetical protein
MKGTLVLAALLLASVPSAHAGTPADGNQLLRYCQLALHLVDAGDLPSQDMGNASHCIGTVHGAADTLIFLHKIQPPNGVTVEQEVRIVVKYLQDHPAKLAKPDVAIIFEALSEVFPAKNPVWHR